MYRKLFHYRKINKKKLVIILAVLFALIMVGGYFGLRQDTRVATIDKIKSYLSNIQFRSGPSEADLSSQMSLETEFDNETGQLTDEVFMFEENNEIEPTTSPEKAKLTLEEISERVNEVSKKVALVSIQVQILTLKDISSQIDGEDLGEDTLEDISEKINQVSEQIESIMFQLE